MHVTAVFPYNFSLHEQNVQINFYVNSMSVTIRLSQFDL